MSAALDVFVNTIEDAVANDLNNFMDMLGDFVKRKAEADGNPMNSVWDTLNAQ